MAKVIILLDDSGSMDMHREGVNKTLSNLPIKAKDKVSLYRFSTRLETPDFVNQSKKRLQIVSYTPTGARTNLYEAISQVPMDLDTPTLFLIITDGEDNVTRRPEIAEKSLRVGLATDMLTVGILCPPHAVYDLQKDLGISNVTGWSTGEEVARHATVGTQVFNDALASGKTSVRSGLFEVNVKGIKGLVPFKSTYKLWEVPSECQIRDFVEDKTADVYKKGNGYYELTKKEEVQEYKNIIVQNKKTKVLYTSTIDKCRDVLGLPQGARVNVEPGNLGNFRVFVQSTSVNRKLVRGSKLLYII